MIIILFLSAITFAQTQNIYYVSKKGKATNPCTKKKPCDIATGVKLVNERVQGRRVVFNGLTKKEKSELVKTIPVQ